QHSFRPEVLLGDATSRTAVPVVVGLDSLESRDDILHGVERKQALAGGQDGTEPGILGDDWPAGGQVAGAAFAEPATAQTYVLVFGDGEFAPRGSYIVAIGPRIGGEDVGVGQSPTARLEQAPLVGGQTVQGHRQLERLVEAVGQVDKLQKLPILAPVIDLALI